mmetsp:Transcript_110499/g.276668  ORF Transcript_110499/g.276668 Transcript_110499/m.276668 type:complete len:495 (-) Transcript_110499:261-1745(-)
MDSPGQSPRSSVTSVWGSCGGTPRVDSGESIVSVSFPLGPELLQLLCRRSRKRLREIQESCNLLQARIDRSQSCLCITGTKAAICAARTQLETLCGPRKRVPKAFWAELMRTRMLQAAPSQIHVLSLQHATGCRVHIERDKCEVRLFGANTNVVEAMSIIDRLQGDCVEAFFPMQDGLQFSISVLEALGRQFGVTLLAAEGGVSVLGLHAAVEHTMRELDLYRTGQRELPQTAPQDADVGSRPLESASQDLAARDLTAERAPNPGHLAKEGTPLRGGDAWAQRFINARGSTTIPMTSAAFGREGHKRRHEITRARGVEMGRMTGHQHDRQFGQHEGTHCPTCGVGRFCGSCGFPVVRCVPPLPQSFESSRAQGENRGSGNACNPITVGEAPPWMHQQVFLVPYSGVAGSPSAAQAMAQACLPMGGMMPLLGSVGAQQGHPGMTNSSIAQGQVYMVPTGVLQQCVMPSHDQAKALESSSPKKSSVVQHPVTCLGS